MTDELEDLPTEGEGKFTVITRTQNIILGDHQRHILMKMDVKSDYTSSELQTLVSRNAKQVTKSIFSLKSHGLIVCLHKNKGNRYKLTDFGAEIKAHFMYGKRPGIAAVRCHSFKEAIDIASRDN